VHAHAVVPQHLQLLAHVAMDDADGHVTRLLSAAISSSVRRVAFSSRAATG
jgi:hypothetical protein